MKMLVLANNKTIAFKKIKPVPVFSFTRFTLSVFKNLFILVIFTGSISLNAQTSTVAVEQYKKVINGRVAKIVNTLGIADSGEYNKILAIIAGQYFSLNNIQEQSKKEIAGLKEQSFPADELTAAVNKRKEEKNSSIKQLHAAFIAQLKTNLTEEQLEKVKDGMTYRVLPLTYSAYLDMLPDLTNEQKGKIYSLLKEARELAMDGESSDHKHAIFGKYKGRINNYLSAAGYDMKKEGQEWQKRIKEKQAKEKNSQ